jgi:hypothetical protein
MSIKLAMNRFWVVSKLLNCAVTFVLLTTHHTTLFYPTIFLLLAGLFKELKRIEPDFSFSKRDRLEHRAFLLVSILLKLVLFVTHDPH